jgi:hypothetical protein
MTQEIVKSDKAVQLEKVLLLGDISSLTAEQKVNYLHSLCESLGLNPLTRPIEFIKMGGKEVCYVKKDGTDQLRKLHNVSLKIVGREFAEGVYVVTAQATQPSGRTDESIGAVSVVGLKGDNLANATMKAETKSKRRVTLSICGLGFLDETEVEGASPRPVEIVKKEHSPSQSPAAAEPTQLAELYKIVADKKIDQGAVRKYLLFTFGVDSSKHLLATECEQAITWAREYV